MTSTLLDNLDIQELVQLGINAGNGGDAASALAYLKAAVAREDAGAMPHFLLGAEYAQSGLIARAVDEMEAALALDPAFALARLQLGLLLLTEADLARSAETLAVLDELPAGNPLRHFGAGLRHLMRDEFAAAERELRTGIEANIDNSVLNRNMELILARLPRAEAALSGDPAAGDPAPAPVAQQGAPQDGAGDAADADADSGWRHMLISTYTTGHGPH